VNAPTSVCPENKTEKSLVLSKKSTVPVDLMTFVDDYHESKDDER